jgi:hypothetical protein
MGTGMIGMGEVSAAQPAILNRLTYIDVAVAQPHPFGAAVGGSATQSLQPKHFLEKLRRLCRVLGRERDVFNPRHGFPLLAKVFPTAQLLACACTLTRV